jgi:hypothetical protein
MIIIGKKIEKKKVTEYPFQQQTSQKEHFQRHSEAN